MTAAPALQVSGLHIYPVKSCGGISLTEAEVGRMGLRYDRQWAFVDERGMFVAQRDARGLGVAVPTMCLIGTQVDAEQLVLTAPGMPALAVPLAGHDGPDVAVRVWDSHTSGVDQGAEASAWATEVLSRERPGRYRLVRMAERTQRRSKLGDGQLGYADAYPCLVISEASLADLNARMPAPLPMNRFRPNLVIRGGAPYVEDTLDRFRIGGVEFTGTTQCVRCPIPTIDQQTAARGKEPLRTLATYRRQPDGVVFGRNVNHAGTGRVRVGDVVEV
jgi:uncharacterized protein YcbX